MPRFMTRLVALGIFWLIALAAPAAPAAAQSIDTYTSPSTRATIRPVFDYAGTLIDVSKMTKAWAAEDQTGGLCDVGTDSSLGAAVAQGKHSLYSVAGTYYDRPGYAGTHSATPSSTVNPFGCVGGKLTIKFSYDQVNGRWQGGEVQSDSNTYFQNDGGYTAPNVGSYWEVQLVMPANPPAGYEPALAFLWQTNSASYPKITDLSGYVEVDSGESGIAKGRNGGTYSVNRSDYTIHQYPPSVLQPGMLTAPWQVGTAGSSLYPDGIPMVVADGQPHTYGLLNTQNWWIMFHNGREVVRFPRGGAETFQGRWTMKINLSSWVLPTASTSASYTVTLNYARAYLCVPATQCPVG